MKLKFSPENMKERDHLEDIGINGKKNSVGEGRLHTLDSERGPVRDSCKHGRVFNGILSGRQPRRDVKIFRRFGN